MTSIAREHNVSVNTVQRVLASCSHRFIDGYDYLPEHLAFDEFKGVDRKRTLSVLMEKNMKSSRFSEHGWKNIYLDTLANSRHKHAIMSKLSPWI